MKRITSYSAYRTAGSLRSCEGDLPDLADKQKDQSNSPSSVGPVGVESHYRGPRVLPPCREDHRQGSSTQATVTMNHLALHPSHYIRRFFVWSTVLFIALNVVWMTAVIANGNARNIPRLYPRLAQITYQGFHCGWFSPAPKDDWSKCK